MRNQLAAVALVAVGVLAVTATEGSAHPAPQPARRPGTVALAAPVSRAGPVARPPMATKLIPFGEARQRQMGRYSKRHYGHYGYRLRHPRVIVEHYTDGPSMMSAWWTMAGNSRDLGELPGVCTHFIVDTDGRVYRLVPLRLRCRHTVGLNDLAIGIEHVGTSDRQVMRNDRQRRSSLRLTLWLMARYDIPVRRVIGHGESLLEPLRHEGYPSWRCLTHTDFSHRTMHGYRQRLRTRLLARGMTPGPGPHWVDLGC